MSSPSASALVKTQTFAPLNEFAFARASVVCIGTGRFLRAVLVPVLRDVGCDIILAQPRGTSFTAYMADRIASGGYATYETDTVLQDGTVHHAIHAIAACGSLALPDGREAFMELPKRLPALRYIGLGVTEAGISHNGSAMLLLAEFLHRCFLARAADDHGHALRPNHLSIINTDNVPFNGDAVRDHVLSCDYTMYLADAEPFRAWTRSHVHFHNTMVDRITSYRQGMHEVPKAEPLPSKALVIEDLSAALPAALASIPGVLVRRGKGQLKLDVQLKLRIANGTHSGEPPHTSTTTPPSSSLFLSSPLSVPATSHLPPPTSHLPPLTCLPSPLAPLSPLPFVRRRWSTAV